MPKPGNHPLQNQAHWLATERGGTIPGEVMESFSKLLALSEKNGVSFEDLCVYALEAANEEKKRKGDPAGGTAAGAAAAAGALGGGMPSGAGGAPTGGGAQQPQPPQEGGDQMRVATKKVPADQVNNGQNDSNN
jgi:hypothetical protein